MNAIFFKATWTSKFDAKDTKDEVFTKADGSSITLPMMYRKAEILYGQNALFTSICLPFGSGDKYSILPRFETKSDIDLKKIISELGAPSMFDSYKADFTGISSNYKNLFVGLLKQKAAIEVNEEGTKTSAVTMAAVEATANPSSKQTITFHANRPFVYLIQEWDTQTIFFIGTFQGN